MKLAVIREGKSLLLLPDPGLARAEHGIEPAWLPVFYNPRMTFNRDLSIAALSVYVSLLAPHRPVHAVDGLSGTGVRAIRYALEVDEVEPIHANDIDPDACSLIRRNILLNGVEGKVRVHCRDAVSLLAELRREEPLLFVDIDPFGSPAPFARQALLATGHMGIAAFTATDLAVLEGSKPRAARRKYWVRISRVPESKEIGLRILIGYLARTAASVDKAVKPLLAYYADHYYRVYLLIERGARKADRMLDENVGYAEYCPAMGATILEPGLCGDNGIRMGPLWTGSLWDVRFLDRVREELERRSYLETRKRALNLINVLREESTVCGGCVYYSLDSIASSIKRNLPRIRTLIEELKKQGYQASRTHFDPHGIRSNAPYTALVSTWRSLLTM